MQAKNQQLEPDVEQWTMSKLAKEYVKAVYCYPTYLTSMGFPGGSVEKNLPAVVGDVKNMGSIPGLGKLPGEGNGNPLWYSCLTNPMDRGALWAIVHGVARVRHDLATEHACMPAEYMMRTTGPMTHKLESRFLGEISAT